MARVTVEDCTRQVPNRFELVLLATRRARALCAGATPAMERERDKYGTLALREIAGAAIDIDALRLSLVSGMQRIDDTDEPEEGDNMALLMEGDDWGTGDGGGYVDVPGDTLDQELEARLGNPGEVHGAADDGQIPEDAGA